jgi:hypothetical protein
LEYELEFRHWYAEGLADHAAQLVEDSCTAKLEFRLSTTEVGRANDYIKAFVFTMEAFQGELFTHCSSKLASVASSSVLSFRDNGACDCGVCGEPL